jgi:Ser-tRNA(Ala) deacylase AlaX
MKGVNAILMLALTIVVASVFAGAVSAEDQTDSQLVVKDENADFRAVHQTTGQNESGNVSKIDLNGAAKPEETGVKNATISESNNGITDIAPVQSAGNSTEIGKEANSSDLQSGNSQELTIEEMNNIKGQGIGDEISKWGRYAWDQLSGAGRYITEHIENFTKRGEIQYTRIENKSGNYTKITGRVYR